MANTTLIPGSVESGTVFKCDARNSSKICEEEVAFDYRCEYFHAMLKWYFGNRK